MVDEWTWVEEVSGGDQGRANADANTQDTTLLVFHDQWAT